VRGRFLIPLLVGLALAANSPSARALENVTSVSTTSSFGTPSMSEGYTFENRERTLNGFSTASRSFGVASLANNVFVRRNNVSPNQSSVWYMSSGTGTNLAGMHEDDYPRMLLSNSVLSGSDNTFANSDTAVLTIGNIERVDFTWNAAITVTDALAFAVFERGVAAQHDGFAIAAITAIDALGNPTAFGSLLKVASGWGGASNPVADQEYRLFRYSAGDTITASTDSSAVSVQGVGGLVFSASDLGLIAGTQVYGYALMAADVTATNSNELLDWNNATFYPTSTDAVTGGGGIDLAAFNGFEFVVVPEPITLPALAVFGAFFAGCNLRRKKRRA
jgi:hypothetical protein